MLFSLIIPFASDPKIKLEDINIGIQEHWVLTILSRYSSIIWKPIILEVVAIDFRIFSSRYNVIFITAYGLPS